MNFGGILASIGSMEKLKTGLLSLSLLVGVFHFYRNGKRLGFKGDKLLDVAIYSLLAGFLVFNSVGRFLPEGAGGVSFLSFLFVFSFLTRREGWSYVKLADLAAESALLAALFLPARILFFNLGALLLFGLVKKIGGCSPKNGLVLYSFLIYVSLCLLIDGLLSGRFINFNFLTAGLLLIASLYRLKTGGFFFECLRLYELLVPEKIRTRWDKLSRIWRRPTAGDSAQDDEKILG